MATNTSKINVTELDFDYIKQELITYLQSQEEFTDYNFEGSALNVLMDMLAYNTHMNAYMANMMGNEMFLDSSSIRQSTVSKAKEIGYTPRSVRSSKALVDVEVRNVMSGVQSIEMDAGTTFDTSYKYTFATKQKYTLYPVTGDPSTYRVEDVDLFDGNYVTFSYNVDLSDYDQRFVIPSVNVDMSTLRVFVKPSDSSTAISEYYINDDLNRLTPDSEVFFTHETPEGFYEVTFGDGILGKNVVNGNYITLTYIVAVGKEDANYVSAFTPLETIGGYGSYYVTVSEPSFGGAEKETLAEIKFLAPKMYQSQRRAVTTQDYETFLLHDYPWIDTINSWGGEYNDPPIYGKVFFAIKPKHTEFMSDKLKEEVKAYIISEYNVVTIVPEIIDPDYIYINVTSNPNYIRSQTTLDETLLASMVSDTIYEYFADTTEKFKMDFRFSPMTTAIDDTEKSIDSSLNSIMFHKRIYPIANTSQTFEVKFNNAIEPGTVETTYFNIEDQVRPGVLYETVIKDDGDGKMQSVHVSTDIVLDSDVGTIDYDTGSISITLFPYTLPADTLDVRIYANPVSNNIVSGYNQIIIPDDSAINSDLNRKQGVLVTMSVVDTEKG